MHLFDFAEVGTVELKLRRAHRCAIRTRYHSSEMRLYQLAFACRLYSSFGREFDEATKVFRQSAGTNLALSDREQGRALMVWLNKWGCRQFAKDHHNFALDQLREWADSMLTTLPQSQNSLIDLSDTSLIAAASAYEALRLRLAGQKRSGGADISVRFGPTGSAKILYALRPECFPPWDDPIRGHFDWDGTGASYYRFLNKVKSEIIELVSDADRVGISLQEIPRVVGRPDSSPPKLVDEYYWITITKQLEIPMQTELARWSSWGRSS